MNDSPVVDFFNSNIIIFQKQMLLPWDSAFSPCKALWSVINLILLDRGVALCALATDMTYTGLYLAAS
jgi:hypothetical protein